MKKSLLAPINFIIDKSNYLRGLLVLIAHDNVVQDHEINTFMKEGSEMGYEKDYLRSSINTLLKNKHIKNDPPRFHNPGFAVKLIESGIEIINKDRLPHPMKVNFLHQVAACNGIQDIWDNKYSARILQKCKS